LLQAVVLGANVVGSQFTRFLERLILAIQNAGSGEVYDLLAHRWVEQAKQLERLGYVDVLGFCTTPGGSGQHRDIDRLQQVSELLDLSHVTRQDGDAGPGSSIQSQLAGVSDKQVQFEVGFLKQGFSHVVTNAATRSRDENPPGGHNSQWYLARDFRYSFVGRLVCRILHLTPE
jgi:hypothetical protein